MFSILQITVTKVFSKSFVLNLEKNQKPQNYSIQIKNKWKTQIEKTIEKEKIIDEKLNGRFKMKAFIALVGAYLKTRKIILGFFKNFLETLKLFNLILLNSY